MLKSGLLNPARLGRIARIRHPKPLVIADGGFSYWPQIETVDLSLVDGLPTGLRVLAALRPNFVIGRAWMAWKFLKNNAAAVQQAHARALAGIPVVFEPQVRFKWRVPSANLILESA